MIRQAFSQGAKWDIGRTFAIHQRLIENVRKKILLPLRIMLPWALAFCVIHGIASAQEKRPVDSTKKEEISGVAVDKDMFVAALRVIRWSTVCEGICRTIVVDSGVRHIPLPDTVQDSGVVVRLSSKRIRTLSGASRKFILGEYQRRPVYGDTALVVISISPTLPKHGDLELVIQVNAAANRWGGGVWVDIVRVGRLWKATLVRQGVS